jgi:hypothetical protein
MSSADVAMEQLGFMLRVMVSDHGVTSIKISLRCTAGVVADAAYAMEGVSVRIASKAKKKDRTSQAPRLLEEMLEWVRENQYTGTAVLSAACYGGQIYRLRRSLETTVNDEEE